MSDNDVTRTPGRKKAIVIVALLLAAILIVVYSGVSVVGKKLYESVLVRGAVQQFLQGYGGGQTAVREPDEDDKWLMSVGQDQWLTADDGVRLHALEVKNKYVSHTYAVICHFFTGDATKMGVYARHYYNMGYHLLLPDARGHGKTECDDISMGWLDRLDVVAWINTIVAEDPEARIILHGVSMGGAEVAMITGEKLPANVRAAIEDCGYTSVYDEFRHVIESESSFPPGILLNACSAYARSHKGWSLKEASALKQVAKSETPTLFIHGAADDFVPSEYCQQLYDACNARREIYYVVGAGHADALSTDPSTYWSKIDHFILDNLGN
ncbi:MAG: alpha/beta hydrolase [Clostridia bacterium]|nr:alpha/beta hydrolase [Clostridia bacterium]